MAARPEQLLRHVRRCLPQGAAEPGDAALLERYVGYRDEAAFAALVERHGPMVLRLCRRILADGGLAEDAFQATFLVLARKAATIPLSCPLAAWLYGVARRVALKARRARTPSPIPDDASDPRPDPLSQLTARELLDLLDEGLQSLPQRQRMPLVLCCLEGRTSGRRPRCSYSS